MQVQLELNLERYKQERRSIMKHIFIGIGGVLCFIAGYLLVGLAIRPWQVLVGGLLLGLEWYLAFWTGEIEGKKRARLEKLKSEGDSNVQ
jgi:uncharacterized membrane protein (Fun14 family)